MSLLYDIAALSLVSGAGFAAHRWVKAELAKLHDKLDALYQKERNSVFTR